MATANQVSQLFVALYNRAIDGVTAQNYAGRAYNQNFISEVIGLTPNLRTMTNQEFVELVYKNALGKDNNSDKEGIDYWVSQANENNWRREELTDNLLRSINAWADQNADTTGLSQDKITLASQGATVFRTKVAIAEQAATTVGGQADTYALTFGSGLEDVTILNYNTTRENNSKVLQGIAARNPLAQSGGTTLALGVNPDTGEGQESFLPTDPNPPASGTSKYVASTAFDDVITGTVAATDPTFTGDTQVDAGAGNDTLKLNMSTSFTGLSGDGKVTNIERIELTNTTVNDNVTFNASGIRDVYTYVLNGANGINLTNVAYNEYLLIELNNIKSTGNTTGSSGASTAQNGGVTQITFDTTPTGGRLDLNFNSVGYDSTDNRISNHDILFGIGSGTAIDPNGSADDFANQAAGIGILNIALTGNNYADIVNTGVNRITVGGNGSLTTNLSRGVTYFNGTNATGSLNITATDLKEAGENGSNIFEYFATGSANDKVHIAVERLGQSASVNLGLGNDTLTLSGQVDHEARKQFYNFNTIENLVFGELTGDALLIDLGTTVVTTPQDPIISGSGSKKTEIPQPDIITTTQDRSANLQTITFDDGASVQLTSLGKKDLKVTYNGTQDDQKVLVDTEGTVNLVLQGSDKGASGTGVKGGGFVNLSNAKAVNVDLTGQGFEGFLSAGNAADLVINNYTGDKKLKLKANTQTEKNDLSSVVNLTIDSEAQDINASGSASTAHSVDIENADLASIKNITLKGTGGVKLGELANKEGITIAGANYSGRLDTGNIYAGPGPLSITTKGAITTGNLTGNNITIDLSKNITTTEGEYNNNIGTIYVERVDATNSSGTLTYTTGISGTQGTANDTQEIVVNTNSATLNINGAGGVDKFKIEASSFTKSLTIAGNLGTVPDHEEIADNYDTVYIDLSKTSGVNLDISNLLVSNPLDEGIVITASKGADNITLVAGANHDVVEFAAGTGATVGRAEVYSIDLANLRLTNKQSFTIDGLTITNINGETGIVRAEAIADAIATYITTGALNTTQAAQFSIDGTLNSLTGDWAGARVVASGGVLTITSSLQRNIKDLSFSFGGNNSTNAPSDISASKFVQSKDATSGGISAVNQVELTPAITTPTPAEVSGASAGFSVTLPTFTANTPSKLLEFSVDGTSYVVAAASPTAANSAELTTIIAALNATSTGANDGNSETYNVYAASDTGYATAIDSPLIALGLKAEAGSGTNAIKIVADTGFDDTTTTATEVVLGSTGSETYTVTPYVGTSAGSPAIGTPASISEGVTNWQPTTQLKASQQNIELLSLTVNGETYKVLATNNSAGDVTLNADIIEAILDDTTSGNDYGIINAGAGTITGQATTAAGGSNVWYKIVNSRNVEDIGISLGQLLSGAGVKASLASGSTTKVILESLTGDPETDFTTDASITLKTGRLHTSSNATWEISAPKGQAAVPETSVVNINIGSKAQTISITGEGMAAGAVRDNVFALLTSGTLLDSSIASNVSINGAAYDASKASDYAKAFALGDGLSYTTSGSAGIDIVAAPGVSLADANISMSQTGQSAAVANQTWNIEGATPATNGEISVTFNALAAGQSYTFNGKTIIATKDLSANKVAESFTLDSDDLYDGAVIVSNFDADAIGEDVLYYINGSTLTIQGTSLESIGASASNVVTGTGSLGVNTNGIKTSTTDGNDGAGSRSDSYVTFSGNLGSEGAAASIAANLGAMDSISNFDVANDGLRLKMANGGYYGEGNVASGALDTLLYVDALGSRIVADVAGGILSFDVVHSQNNESTTGANAITLDQKLYVATNSIGDNAIAGFAHGGDFYVIATGANGDSTTDDIVVRLNGVAGVTDISTILA